MAATAAEQNAVGLLSIELRCWIDMMNSLNSAFKFDLEVCAPSKAISELLLELVPRDEARPSKIVESVGKPTIDVDSHWIVREGIQDAKIDWNSSFSDVVQKILTQRQLCLPGKLRMRLPQCCDFLARV